MFITMPIKKFKLKGNKLYINESIIEYDNISDDNKEILESLISKGAYGSALLTLNKFSNVKSINESKCNKINYLNYLNECNKLMEVNTFETEAQNFRPLINLDGLEIMENDKYIARGKGSKLLIEDFRNKNVKSLKEEYITIPEDGSDGWGDDIEDLTYDFFDMTSRVDYEIKNAMRGSYGIEGNDIDDLIAVFEDISARAQDIANELSRAEIDYQSDDDYEEDDEEESINESCEGTQCSDIAPKKDQEVGKLQKPKRRKRKNKLKESTADIDVEYVCHSDTDANNDNEYFDNEEEAIKYAEEHKDTIDVVIRVDYETGEEEQIWWNEMYESKKISKGKALKEKFNIPINHGFKGFRLNESGMYTRGNYVLINENGKIKAINKKKLNK